MDARRLRSKITGAEIFVRKEMVCAACVSASKDSVAISALMANKAHASASTFLFDLHEQENPGYRRRGPGHGIGRACGFARNGIGYCRLCAGQKRSRSTVRRGKAFTRCPGHRH